MRISCICTVSNLYLISLRKLYVTPLYSILPFVLLIFLISLPTLLITTLLTITLTLHNNLMDNTPVLL